MTNRWLGKIAATLGFVVTIRSRRSRPLDVEPLLERIATCCISSLAVASVIAVLVLSVVAPSP